MGQNAILHWLETTLTYVRERKPAIIVFDLWKNEYIKIKVNIDSVFCRHSAGGREEENPFVHVGCCLYLCWKLWGDDNVTTKSPNLMRTLMCHYIRVWCVCMEHGRMVHAEEKKAHSINYNRVRKIVLLSLPTVHTKDPCTVVCECGWSLLLGNFVMSSRRNKQTNERRRTGKKTR